MLSIGDHRPDHNCQGFRRRDFLQIGALGFGGLSLVNLLAAKAAAAAENPLRGKSVVLLFLQGGPSHIEFFDPKMSAPDEIRSITGEVKTKHAGITFGGTFPKLAKLTDKFSIVRSYGSKNAGHSYLAITSGGNPLKCAMGAIYSRVAGPNHPVTGMPSNILVKPEAISGDLKLGSNFETGELHTLTSPGDLGPGCGAFDSSGGGPLQENMQLRIRPQQLADRRSLLSELDRLRWQTDGELAGAGRYQQQAFELITTGVAEAFDLSRENPQVLARYDTQHIFKMKELQRWGDMRRTTNLLGRQMLLARRLCEAGCGFVTVSDCGWDMHANNNSPKGMTAMWPMGNQVDHAVSAFIEDVHARGLQNDILLIVTGEMGRSPRINNNGGREHYGDLTPILFSGGGLKMGQIIGKSDHHAARPVTTAYDPSHLLGTVMQTLFDLGQLRVVPGMPREIVDLTSNAPVISELV